MLFAPVRMKIVWLFLQTSSAQVGAADKASSDFESEKNHKAHSLLLCMNSSF